MQWHHGNWVRNHDAGCDVALLAPFPQEKEWKCFVWLSEGIIMMYPQHHRALANVWNVSQRDL